MKRDRGTDKMRIADYVIAAAVVAGLSGPAAAQSTTTAGQPAPQPATNGQSSTTTTPTTPSTYSDIGNWFASAYLGSNFSPGGSSAFDTNLELDTGSNTSVNFGGEVGYAFSGMFGAEFMLNYSPNFELNDTLLQRRPRVATYMANGIAAVPIGGDHRFRPFVSGGIGAITMRATTFTSEPLLGTDVSTLDTTRNTKSRFGWDLGGGVMAFNGSWGLRGDVRYYKATTDDNLNDGTIEGLFFQRELSGLSFWNANFGIAFRW